MSSLAQLTSALRSAEGKLAALGAEPKGDVPGMKVLAKAIRAEAEVASAAGRGASRLPRMVAFRGPAADQLAANSAMVGGAVRGAVAKLEHAAEQVEHEAAKIHREQEAWRRERHRLEHLVADLAGQIRGAR
jgi:hypothetical protein